MLLLALLACADPTDEPADSAPTGPQEEADVLTYVPPSYTPQAPQRLVFLGDSITAGEGENDWDLLYKELLQENVRRWRGFDDIDLESVWPDLTDVVDVSRAGATTDTLLSSQLPRLEEQLTFPAVGETIVVFTVGGNDLQAALVPTSDPVELANAVLDKVGDIVAWLQDPARFPDGVHIYATNVYEPTDGTGQHPDCFYGISYTDRIPVLEDYNDRLRQLGEDMGFSVVDLRGHFLGHGYYRNDPTHPAFHGDDPTLWLLEDCIHPNKRGHHEVRRLFFHAITDTPLMHVLPQ